VVRERRRREVREGHWLKVLQLLQHEKLRGADPEVAGDFTVGEAQRTNELTDGV
jgi:hypothetical protein